MRIAFFGLPLAGLLLHRDGHELISAAICRTDALGLRRIRKLVPDAEILPDLNGAYIDRIRSRQPDLIVSWFWTKKLPPEILAIAPAVGIHPSLLPRHRGADPFFWAIWSGDEVTGVTAHRLDAGYDTGPILAQRTLRIDPSWNGWKLARKLDRPSLALLREVVAKGDFRGTPQDEALATAAPEPDDETLTIRWRDPAATVLRLVRAASPWPGAFTELGTEVVALTKVAVTSDVPRALLPGEAWVRKDGSVVVRAGDEGVELIAGQNERGMLDRKALGELLSGR